MIAKSDLIILAVSTTALAVGVYRWQTNARAPNVAAAPPPPLERVVESAPVADASRGDVAPAADTDPLVGNVRVDEDEAVVVRRVPDAPAPTGAGDDGETAPASPSVPATNPSSAGTGSADPVGGEPLYGRHVIENGEYLGLLAERFGTSVATLQSINDLAGTTILVGDELLYPLPAN